MEHPTSSLSPVPLQFSKKYRKPRVFHWITECVLSTLCFGFSNNNEYNCMAESLQWNKHSTASFTWKREQFYKLTVHLNNLQYEDHLLDTNLHLIDPTQKGVSLFLSYTNMNKMASLHHVKELPKISNFLQFESHSSNCVKVRAT